MRVKLIEIVGCPGFALEPDSTPLHRPKVGRTPVG